mgnify:CR=1 FL=1
MVVGQAAVERHRRFDLLVERHPERQLAPESVAPESEVVGAPPVDPDVLALVVDSPEDVPPPESGLLDEDELLPSELGRGGVPDMPVEVLLPPWPSLMV